MIPVRGQNEEQPVEQDTDLPKRRSVAPRCDADGLLGATDLVPRSVLLVLQGYLHLLKTA